SVYQRRKNDAGAWRYERIKAGRGVKTGDLQPPFFTRMTRNGKQGWPQLQAATFKDAQVEIERLEAGVEAQGQGFTVAELANPDRLTVAKAVATFLDHAEKSKKKKTVNGYRLNLKQFQEATSVVFLDQVTRDVLRDFRDWLSAQGYDPRTQHNRLMTILSVLKENKISTGFSLTKDLPTYEEDPPVPFSEEELKKLFAAMDEQELIRYKFFLGTAAREQEVQYATWQDIDFDKMEFHVRPKKDVGFTPKNHEKRSVPMPASLVALMKKYRKNPTNTRWLFVNRDDQPDGHFLKKFKRIALHAGVNCGECKTTVTKGRYESKQEIVVSCKDDPVCKHIFLHRLRKTCASRWEAAGIPVRTIQAWLGHKDLNTTQKYLGVVDSSKLRGGIDKAFGD
ncbi:MAG: tyrosine-type recombinase/integrase, partial [Candidatus Udaeobacter sp.]